MSIYLSFTMQADLNSLYIVVTKRVPGISKFEGETLGVICKRCHSCRNLARQPG